MAATCIHCAVAVGGDMGDTAPTPAPAPLAGTKRKAEAEVKTNAPIMRLPPMYEPAYCAFAEAVDNADWKLLARKTLCGDQPWQRFVDTNDADFRMPLCCAAVHGSVVCSNENMDITDTQLCALVLLAAGAQDTGYFVSTDWGDYEAYEFASLEELIESDCDDDEDTLEFVHKAQLVRKRGGLHALHMAAACDAAPLVVHLLACGAAADVNSRDKCGNTPLHIALQYGASLDTVKALIDAGAQVTAENAKGHTPLQYAISRSKCEQFMDKATTEVMNRARAEAEAWVKAAAEADVCVHKPHGGAGGTSAAMAFEDDSDDSDDEDDHHEDAARCQDVVIAAVLAAAAAPDKRD